MCNKYNRKHNHGQCLVAAALKCQADKNALASTYTLTRSEQGGDLCIPENGINNKKSSGLVPNEYSQEVIQSEQFLLIIVGGDQIKAEDILLTEHFKSPIHSGFIISKP